MTQLREISSKVVMMKHLRQTPAKSVTKKMRMEVHVAYKIDTLSEDMNCPHRKYLFCLVLLYFEARTCYMADSLPFGSCTASENSPKYFLKLKRFLQNHLC